MNKICPLVSIVMPNYNGAKYIIDAIESTLAQTYQDWELLVIDDGSTDNSLEIISYYAQTDSRVRLLFHDNHANKGVSCARNLGLSNANGKYIALLDSDDLWLHDKLQQQVEVMQSDPSLVLTYSLADVIDSNGVLLSQSDQEIKFHHVAGSGLPGKSIVFEGMLADKVWMPCLTVMFRSEVLKSVYGFEEGLKFQSEDHVIFTLISNLGPIYFVNRTLARYRVHPNSYTSRNRWQLFIFEYYCVIYNRLPSVRNLVVQNFNAKLGEFGIVLIHNELCIPYVKHCYSIIFNDRLFYFRLSKMIAFRIIRKFTGSRLFMAL